MNDMNNNLRNQVGVAAYYLAQKNYSYDVLCWMLAERQLFAQKDPRYAEKQRIREKAAEIFFSKQPYDIVCWYIAELDISLKIKKSGKPRDRIL
ncbi:unnamed protein product [marine sediment metagenome]|uniref:Uncharacterized protein n=1 Tax=marine sediment metagenome TaxID=412755 RepID=X0Z6L2_9ZZZZ